MKRLILVFAAALSLFATGFAQSLYVNPYPPAIDLIDATSYSGPAPAPPAVTAVPDDTDFFPFVLSTFERVYQPLERQGSVVQSVDEDWRDPVSKNYAATLDQFLERNTRDYEQIQEEAVLTTLDGRQVKFDKISTTDPDAVFSGKSRIPLASLTPDSRALAREIIRNFIFDRQVRISVEKKYRKIKEWRPYGEEGSGFRLEHNSYAFVVEVKNRSDVSLKNLILEYQIFFRQSLAGTPLRANDYYRFVGFIVIDELLSQQQHLALRQSEDRDVVETFPDRRLSDPEERVRRKLGFFTITPPSLSSGEYRQKRRQFFSSRDGLITSGFSQLFPNDFNQDYDSRMMGVWIRLHRITPQSHAMVEYKDDVFPRKTSWDDIRGQLGQF